MFSISPGAGSCLVNLNSRLTKKAVMSLHGDLSQMGQQAEFLSQRGFDIQWSGGIPCLVNETDIKPALQGIWDCSIEGFWHYQEQFSQHGIATPAQFNAKLDRRCAQHS